VKLVGTAIDEHDGTNDHGRGDPHLESECFAAVQPAKQDSNDRVHVGVRRYQRGRIALQEPVVRREGYNRAKDDEVGESQPRFVVT